MMSDWIDFEDASYLVEQAFVVAPDNSAVALEQTIITIDTGKGGKKHLSGSGLVQNALLVELLEENDDFDLLLDMGAEFKYRLVKPKITAGKVFAPDVKSRLQFAPISPWHQIPEPEFANLLAKLKFL